MWTPSFDFYLAEIEDRPLSILVDLAAAEHAPLVSHPVRLFVRCPLQKPRSDGLRDESEIDDLNALEERVVTAFQARGLIYVGRTLGTGLVIFFFYGPSRMDPAELEQVAGIASPYVPAVRLQRDVDWEDYFEFLFPDSHALHGIMNRRLTGVLAEAGDRLDQERSIEHEALFPSEAKAHAAGVALTGVGFEVDPLRQSEAGVLLPFRAPAAPAEIDRVTTQILDILEFHKGDYVGWGCEKVV